MAPNETQNKESFIKDYETFSTAYKNLTLIDVVEKVQGWPTIQAIIQTTYNQFVLVAKTQLHLKIEQIYLVMVNEVIENRHLLPSTHTVRFSDSGGMIQEDNLITAIGEFNKVFFMRFTESLYGTDLVFSDWMSLIVQKTHYIICSKFGSVYLYDFRKLFDAVKWKSYEFSSPLHEVIEDILGDANTRNQQTQFY